MTENTKKKFSIKFIITIISSLLLFFGFIFIFASFMNQNTLNKYKEKGISLQASVDEISSYKQKLTKKSTSTTKFMVKLDFYLKGLPGSAFVSEYVSEEEIDSLKEGQRVEILYLPGTDYVANGKATFVTSPIMKTTLENASNRVSNNLFIGYIIFGIGILSFASRFFIKS